MTYSAPSPSVSPSNAPLTPASPSLSSSSDNSAFRQIHFGRPIIGEAERRAVLEVLESPILVHGPRALKFEEDFAAFTNGGQAITVSSCTAGLHLGYFQLGLGAGDEVIVPAQTHTATAHAVEYVGAKPVFVDAEPETGNIDIDRIEAAITPATKAISIVHYLGMPVDMVRINAIAAKHGLFVMEDAALAVGTYLDGIHAGLMGDMGCFSFYPVKHMTTAEGGMVLTRDDALAERIRRKKAFGLDRTVTERKEPGVYDVTQLGFNYRMNEMQAAMGIEQLKQVQGFLDARHANYERLEAGLKELDGLHLFQSSNGRFQSSHYCLSVVLKGARASRRSDVAAALNAQGVGTSVYYPGPVPALAYYSDKYGLRAEDFPNATEISRCSIALPVGPHLNHDDMDFIIHAMKKALHDVR
ncbi:MULTISPECIES: DegT/DnrJ/EryC1/StrS family aminotransferase [unclassified Minwuia]|jgi:perosamine synthetase|uniref:DegT/DnrJ/EryC1/StrS family aminotransferase n=1 Tax=unclassified Minwuia TaxID=2618799 RepID=UPI00247A6109|nr:MULTISPECIES: DegT/DnrJ/EryC1/StrS family aminotransferase [unclassified Minwuia]